jgi:hypothetical protein
MSSGDMHVSYDPSLHDTATVEVQLANSPSSKLLSQIEVCQVQHGDSVHGVAIFVCARKLTPPSLSNAHDRLHPSVVDRIRRRTSSLF